MRRLISLTLLLLFSLPLISPALAYEAVSGSNLALCCRRNGAHHCAMNMEQAAALADAPEFSAPPQKCPAYPASVTPVRHGDLALHAASMSFAEIASHPAVKAQTLVRVSAALDRLRYERGPPAGLL